MSVFFLKLLNAVPENSSQKVICYADVRYFIIDLIEQISAGEYGDEY